MRFLVSARQWDSGFQQGSEAVQRLLSAPVLARQQEGLACLLMLASLVAQMVKNLAAMPETQET